jgi:hypothetical protein
MPPNPRIHVVLDPDDTRRCVELVAGLHNVAAGRVVCHATRGTSGRGLGGLSLELLVALGKRFDAARLERVHARRGWELVELWTAAEGTRDLLVLRAHLLHPSQWDRLIRLADRCRAALWLIVHEPRVRARHAGVLQARPHHRQLTMDEFATRWHAPTVVAAQPPADEFPEVPSADFPTFRAACRQLLDTASFQRVDQLYNQTLRAAREWVRDRPIDWYAETPSDAIDTDAVAALLQRLTVASTSPSETLVRLRAAQAGLFLHGILLTLDLSSRSMIGPTDLRATLSPTVATRLRGLCTPEWTAATALALLADPHARALGALDLRDVAPDASQVTIGRLKRLHVPTYARSLILVQLLQRHREGASVDAPLFVDKTRTQRHDHAAMAALVSSVAAKLGISPPRLGIEHRPQGKGLGAAWLARRGLTVTRIDDPYPWSLASP